MSKPTLIYFPARGRAEVIRLVLAEAGIDHDEHPVGHNTQPSNGRPTDFAALKASGALAFDAVPTWEEPGGFRLAQSTAIANHLARTHGLQGKTPLEAAQCDQLLGAVDDVRVELRKLVTGAADGRAALRAELTTATLPRWLGYFDRLLKANRDGTGFVVGDSVSLADLALWYLLEMLGDNGFAPVVAQHPTLVSFAARIGQRPRIASYLNSARRHPLVRLPA